MKFDELPEYLRVKWWRAAEDEYSKRPLESLRMYELQALCWFYARLMEGWKHEEPQSYEEALLWHQHQHQLAQARLEQAKRAAASAERSLQNWQAKRQGDKGV